MEREARVDRTHLVRLLLSLGIVVVRMTFGGVAKRTSISSVVRGRVVGSGSVTVDGVLSLVQDRLQRHAVGVKCLLGGVRSESKHA
jgi:hypothetical protein